MAKNRFLMVAPDTVNDLLALQKVYSTVYVPFLRNLAVKFGYSTQLRSEVLDLLKRIQRLVRGISKVVVGRATKKEVEILLHENKEILKRIEFYQREMREDEQLARDLSEAARATGLRIDSLKKLTELIEKKRFKVRRFREVRAPELRELGLEAVREVLPRFLGPFAPIAELGWQLVRGIGRGIYRTYAGARYGVKQTWGARIEDILGELKEEMHVSALETPRRPTRRGRMTMAERYEMIRRRTPEEWHALGLPAPGEEFWRGGRWPGRPVSIDEFFEKKAYKARWTKEVLKSLKNIEKGQKDAGKKFGLSLGGLLGLGLAAAGATAVYKYLDKFVQEAKEAAKAAKKAAENTEINRRRIAESVDKISQKYKDDRLRKLHQLRTAKAALPPGSPLEKELDMQIKALEEDLAKHPAVTTPTPTVPTPTLPSEMVLGGERVKIMTPEAYERFLESVEKLNDNVSEVGNAIKDIRNTPQTGGEVTEELPHDIGDPLVDGLNSGGLEWGY